MGEAIKIAPYVAFFPEPATAQSRFLIQGYVDREEIAAAVEALPGCANSRGGTG